MSSDEIAAITPQNRMVGFPYRKGDELEQQRRHGRRHHHAFSRAGRAASPTYANNPANSG